MSSYCKSNYAVRRDISILDIVYKLTIMKVDSINVPPIEPNNKLFVNQQNELNKMSKRNFIPSAWNNPQVATEAPKMVSNS